MSVKYRNYSYTAKREHRKKVRSIILLILFIFLINTIITKYLVKSYKIYSESMEPEIHSKQLVLASYLYNPENSLKRGDVVLVSSNKLKEEKFFRKAVNSLFNFFSFQKYKPFRSHNNTENQLAFRRIVGLPGDTIYMKDFILHIKTKQNNHFLTEFEVTETDYNLQLDNLPKNWDSNLPFSGSYPQTTLKKNEYFVLSDNRLISDDSRFWGPINSTSQIQGKLLIKYWPFSKFKLYK